ncbi:SPOR domain-containing protein [Cellulomonas rhizosphaerae]|uniref:SPOR domain-containing protein n=1 Tax=Cellulomonas rhizosphaerae TaxID=2293719 RepID=A0A413RHA7_9CELL|nr:SPOR domain-containing protein [Cellulomonas rhizosphaerae]RHA37527.1 SPOR domain-containing protein [Cellulomonas rhizosphaerae]
MAGDFWFNTETHEVEEGRTSDWSKLMGPYGSRDEAAHALDKAKARAKEWEAEED